MSSSVRPGGPRRGRPALIDRDTLVTVAAGMNPDTLTMSAVAAELGVSPSALYRWVADREALLDLVGAVMVERITPDRVAGPDDWRSWLRDWAQNVRREFSVVPGFAARVLTGPHRHPAHDRLTRAGERTYVAAGATAQDARRCWYAFSVAVVGAVAAQHGHLPDRDEEDFDALVTILLRGTDPGRSLTP